MFHKKTEESIFFLVFSEREEYPFQGTKHALSPFELQSG